MHTHLDHDRQVSELARLDLLCASVDRPRNLGRHPAGVGRKSFTCLSDNLWSACARGGRGIGTHLCRVDAPFPRVRALVQPHRAAHRDLHDAHWTTHATVSDPAKLCGPTLDSLCKRLPRGPRLWSSLWSKTTLGNRSSTPILSSPSVCETCPFSSGAPSNRASNE